MGGFFDEYQGDGGGGVYVSADEKRDMIDSAIPFVVRELTLDDNSQFGERYLLKVTIDSDPEQRERLMSFQTGSVESRDRMLEGMRRYLEVNPEDNPRVILEKKGRSQVLSQA